MRVVDKNSRAYLFVPYIALMLLYLKVSLFRYLCDGIISTTFDYLHFC